MPADTPPIAVLNNMQALLRAYGFNQAAATVMLVAAHEMMAHWPEIAAILDAPPPPGE